MGDNEIIKALKCCITKRNQYCISCPFSKETNCTLKMLEKTLDLINRQKAEIERLTEEINALNGNTEKYIAECEKRSREIVEDYRKEIKSEAIKKFANRLKCGVSITSGIITCEDIDNLVKEMTEENDDKQKA